MSRLIKIAKYDFCDPIRIFNIGDVHRGNHNCNTQFLRNVVQIIADNPNYYWISTGDLLEVATKASVSSVYESINVQSELELLVRDLSPIKDKCLGFVASNHHNRIDKESGVSLDKYIATSLSIPFLGITGIIRVSILTGHYYICLHHGIGGGTHGGKLNNAMRVASNYLGADIYMSGHTHTYSHSTFLQQVISRKKMVVRKILSHVVITGHCLSWEGSYAEKMALHPAPIGFSYVDLGININGNDINKDITPGFFGING